jgi:UDP-N-acetylglucosamine 2-epimerase
MLDQVLTVFNIKPGFDIDVMTENQQLAATSAKILTGIANVLESYNPDIVVVHGDTTSSYIASLAAFYLHIPVAHVEAGLRTGNMYSPWPEEFNRRSIGSIAALHFAPTVEALENLLTEQIPASIIEVTGNTVIDALQFTNDRLQSDPQFRALASLRVQPLDPGKPIVLVTAHRRENLDGGIQNICEAIATIAKTGRAQFVFPVHKNPRVRSVVHKMLSDNKNILLTEPLDYPEVVYLMSKSYIILTDSGGIQEEAAALRKPCLVMRDTTERPELVAAGGARLVGTSVQVIVDTVMQLLRDEILHKRMQINSNPYGDGFAAERIAKRLSSFLSQSSSMFGKA